MSNSYIESAYISLQSPLKKSQAPKLCKRGVNDTFSQMMVLSSKTTHKYLEAKWTTLSQVTDDGIVLYNNQTKPQITVLSSETTYK